MNAQSNLYKNRVEKPGTPVVIRDFERKRINGYVTLALIDIFTISISFISANLFYFGYAFASHGITMLSVFVPIYLWTAAINGSYRGQVLKDPRIGAYKSARAICLAASALLIIAYSFKVGEVFSRFIFWSGTITAIISTVLSRIVVGNIILKSLGGTPFSTVVVVDDVQWNAEQHDIVIDIKDIGFDPQTDDPLHYHKIAKIVAHADRVLVACQDEAVPAWAHVLKCMAIDGEIIAPDVDRIGVIGVSRHGDRRTLIVSAGPLHLRERILKRVFDLTVASLALVILFPILVTVAIAIRLESKGPILFRQQRIGRDNTLFMMFKFRSMYTEMCDTSASILTSRADNRVTKVGNFIRKNSIDELPQLINVLRGEMSIVGPRPHALSARADQRLYWEIDERYRHRHAVKPGVTGLAQIRGFRGATVLATDLTNRLASDLEYLRDWSMGKDLWILFRTIFVIRHSNAF